MTGNREKGSGTFSRIFTGRRAMFMSHVALKLPKGGEYSHFLIRGGLKGQKLSEGDPPAIFPVDQEGLGLYASDWKSVRAQVSDSTGKKWLSKKINVAGKGSGTFSKCGCRPRKTIGFRERAIAARRKEG